MKFTGTSEDPDVVQRLQDNWDTQTAEIRRTSKPKKKSSKKDKLMKEIEDVLTMVKSIKIPKKSKHDDVTKHLKAVTKAQMIKEIEDTIKKVEGVKITPNKL